MTISTFCSGYTLPTDQATKKNLILANVTWLFIAFGIAMMVSTVPLHGTFATASWIVSLVLAGVVAIGFRDRKWIDAQIEREGSDFYPALKRNV